MGPSAASSGLTVAGWVACARRSRLSSASRSTGRRWTPIPGRCPRPAASPRPRPGPGQRTARCAAHPRSPFVPRGPAPVAGPARRAAPGRPLRWRADPVPPVPAGLRHAGRHARRPGADQARLAQGLAFPAAPGAGAAGQGDAADAVVEDHGEPAASAHRSQIFPLVSSLSMPHRQQVNSRVMRRSPGRSPYRRPARAAAGWCRTQGSGPQVRDARVMQMRQILPSGQVAAVTTARWQRPHRGAVTAPG